MAISFVFIRFFLKKTGYNKKLKLKIASPVSTGSHGKYTYMKYVSFPWSPVVAAHDRNRLT
jgi:hypothetical protein